MYMRIEDVITFQKRSAWLSNMGLAWCFNYLVMYTCQSDRHLKDRVKYVNFSANHAVEQMWDGKVAG